MRVLVIFFYLFYSLVFFSQSNLDWVKTFGTNRNNAYPSPFTDIVNDVSGNTYFIGQFKDSATLVLDSITLIGDGLQNLVYGKISFDGDLLWVKSLNGYTSPSDIDIDSENNILISGQFLNTVDFDQSANESIMSHSDGSGFLLKVDIEGNFLNVIQFFNSGVICTDNLGNTYYSNQFTDYSDNFRHGFQISKIDANNNLIWSKKVLETTISTSCRPFELDYFDNKLIVVGVFEGIYDFNPDTLTENIVYSEFGESYFMLSLTSNGEFNFLKTILGSNQIPTDLRDVKIGNDSCIYIIGDFQEILDFDPETNIFEMESYDTDIFLAKYSLSGNLIWAKSFYNNWVQFGHSIFLDSLNNIFLTGTFSGLNFDFDPNEDTVILSESFMNDNAYIINLKNNGEFNYAYIFKSQQNVGMSIGNEISFAQNSIFLAGSFKENLFFEPNQESNLINALGDNYNGFILKINRNNLSIVETLNDQFDLFPNPAIEYIQIDKNQQLEILKIKIYNSSCKVVKSMNEFLIGNKIDISDLQIGSYFITIETKSGTFVKKFIVK